MNKIKFLLSSILLMTVASQSLSQNSNGTAEIGSVVGTTDVVVSDIPSYVAALKANPQAFSTLGTNLAGFCQAVSGGAPGEALVFSFSDSMEAGLAAIETQLTDPSFQRFVATLEPYRELTGTRQARVIRPYDGELYQTWATRNLMISTENPDEYIAAASNLERAARANGYSDFSLTVQQEMGSGGTSDLLIVIAVAPSLARLGASIDAIYEEQWAQTAFANVVAARSQIVDDKIYRCEQVYLAM
jgi:hypothetical protein